MLNGTNIWVPLKEVGDETTWRQMNQYPQTSTIATHFFVRGGDEFGIYPIPSAAVSNSIELVYEPKHILLTADDYTTGTISLTNGSATVTGTGTTFTPAMANGSYVLQELSGNDGNYYRISGYSSGTSLTLENFYQGITTASATYRIGQVSKIPEEYQEAPVDYAMYRHFMGKNEMQNSGLFQKNWMASLEDAENTYGMSTGSQIVTASQAMHTYNPLTDVSANMIRT